MPIINGQKVACTPCIRGHRSTKCNHASERVMVPVRKPGRPLSTCPCPPDRPCGCGGVRVAIPRKQKCGCGGADDHESENPQEPVQIPTEIPASPTSTRPSYRVSKSSSGSRHNGRKQSFEPSQLGRMDPNSVNIVNHFGSIDATGMDMLGNHINTRSTTTGETGLIYTTLEVNGFGQAMGLSYQAPPLAYGPVPRHIPQTPQVQQISQPVLIQNGIKESHSAMPTPVMATVPPARMANEANGQNGVSSNGVIPTTTTDAATPLPTPANGSSQGRRSCCQGAKKESPELKPNMAPPPPPTEAEKPYLSQLPHGALGLKTHSYPDPFVQQTVYTYPANYGSFSNPVNQDLWLQISNMNGALSVDGSADPLGFSHECSCGPGCACVGCMAHPFNQEMFDYVSNAYNDAGVSPTEPYPDTNGNDSHAASASSTVTTAANSSATPSSGGSISSSNGNGAAVSSCCGGGSSGSAQAPTQGTGPSSPAQAHTPSDASGFSEEQALSTSDYFFVNIPYDPSACSGSEVFCPCGDDCACDGCVVHKTRIGTVL